jgi:hypothetical protein
VLQAAGPLGLLIGGPYQGARHPSLKAFLIALSLAPPTPSPPAGPLYHTSSICVTFALHFTLHCACCSAIREISSASYCPLPRCPRACVFRALSSRRRAFAELLVLHPGFLESTPSANHPRLTLTLSRLTTFLLRFSGCASLGCSRATSLRSSCLSCRARGKSSEDGLRYHCSHPSSWPRASYLSLEPKVPFVANQHSLWTHGNKTTRSQV